jgi:hypothetical protein
MLKGGIMENKLVHGPILDIQEMNNRINEMQELLREVFREGVDYGYIPGMKERKEREDAEFANQKRKEKSAIKPMLLKPGVEKINTRYNLFPFYTELPTNPLPGDHRETRLICELRILGGIAVAQGVGSCSTYESKYRYRWENTDKPVPQEYWDSRDPEILGGKQFAPRKIYDEDSGKTSWFIFEKIGVADPADAWNTIFKMAAKRAKSDATFSATAAGDIFNPEDLEDPDLIPPKENDDKNIDPFKNKKAPIKDDIPKEAPTEDQIRGLEVDLLDHFGNTEKMEAWLFSITSREVKGVKYRGIKGIDDIKSVGLYKMIRLEFNKAKKSGDFELKGE